MRSSDRAATRAIALSLAFGLLLGLAISADSVSAQDLRKAKIKDVQIKVVVPGKQPQKRSIGKIGPTKLDPGAQEVLSGRIAEKERLMSQKRQAMIKAVDEILAANPNYHAKWDRLFQKAELQWEEARYEYFQKRKDYETQLEAFHEKRSTTKPVEPKGNYGPAVETYKQIVAGQPNYRRLDEVLYHLGDALIKADQGVEAVTTLGQLTSKFPRSKYVADAYLALAELYFDKNKFVAAHDNYQAVVTKFPQAQVTNYARYKLAWTFFNLKDYRKAINQFKSVVDTMRGGDQAKINFRNQALNDLIVAFAEVDDGWQEARDYFQRTGGEPLALEKLRKMSRYYDGQDKSEETLAVLRFLIQRGPGSPDVPELHEFFIDTLKKINNPKRLEAELRKIIEFYAPSGPFMVQNKGAAKVTDRGAKIAEDALDFVAASFHSEAQRFNDNARYRLAAQGYDEFVRRFPQSARAYKINFYLAEILLRIEDYEGAAVRYQQVVARGKGEYFEDASYKTIFAYAEQLKKLGLDRDIIAEPIGGARGKAKGVAGVAPSRVPRTPLQPVEQKFVKASEQFAGSFPRSDDTPVILYKAAKVYYQHGNLAEAAARLIQIIKDHPRHKFAAHSGTLVLDCYNQLEDWANIEKWARHLLTLRNFQDKSQKDLRNIVAQAMSKLATELESQKKYVEASKVMLRVVDEFPKAETADKALFNAAAIAERAAQRDRAIELYERLKRQYPKSELVPQARFVIGAIYESRGQFQKAAQNFAQMAKEKATDKTADAIFNAAVIREALGEHKEAIATFQAYMKLYPKRDDIPAVYLRIGDILEKSRDYGAAVKHFEDFAKKFPGQGQLAVEAFARAGLAAQKGAGPAAEPAPTGKKGRRARGGGKGVGLSAANGYFNKAVEAFRKVKAAPGSEAARYAAWARFQQGEVLFQEFEAIRFRLPESQMKRTFGEKKAALGRVIKAYLEVAQFRSPEWAAAAAYKIGLAYQKLSEAFFEAPVPPDFKEEDKETYRAQLQEFAVPIEEQAIDAFEKAVRLAHKQRIYNQWTALSGKHLAKYKKDEYPLLDRATLRPGVSAETERAAPVQKVLPAPAKAAPKATSSTAVPGQAAAL